MLNFSSFDEKQQNKIFKNIFLKIYFLNLELLFVEVVSIVITVFEEGFL